MTTSTTNTKLITMNSAEPSNDVEMKGFLLKWTNYIKGYRKRWFLLSGGFLYYYKNPSIGKKRRDPVEMICRGKIPMQAALINLTEPCTFDITDRATQTFHIKTENEDECQAWLAALQMAQAKWLHVIPFDANENNEKTVANISSHDLDAAKHGLSFHLDNLKIRYDLVAEHGLQLQKALDVLENGIDDDMPNLMKIANECATQFRASTNALTVACNDYAHNAENRMATVKGSPLHSILFEDVLPFYSLKVIE